MSVIKYLTMESALKILSFLLILVGLGILILFLVQLSNFYSVTGDNPLMLPETGQVGDFIGGLVGSLWTLASVLLFYLAIRLQTKELGNQIKEIATQNKTLELQREEFEISRLTQIIYKQIDRIDNFMNNFGNTFYQGGDSNHKESYYAVNTFVERLESPDNYDTTRVKVVDRNYKNLLMFVDIYNSSTGAIYKTLEFAQSLSQNRKTQMMILYRDNLNSKSLKLITLLNEVINDELYSITLIERLSITPANDIFHLKAKVKTFESLINKMFD